MSRRTARQNRRIPTGDVLASSEDPFSPEDVDGLLLWLRGDMGITIATGVSSWADQSGNGNSVVQATTAKQPTLVTGASGINNRPCVKGNGTSQFLAMSSSLPAVPVTCFVVAQLTDQTALRAAVSTLDGLGFVMFSDSPTTMLLRSGATGIDVTANASQPHIYAGVFNLASSAAYLDGAKTSGTTAAIDVSGVTVLSHQGTSLYWDNVVAEVIYYSTLLAAADISRIGQYLGQRYAIANTF